MHVPNPIIQGHLQGPMWMKVKYFPDFSFEAASVDTVRTEGNKTTADVTGTMTIKGVSHKITVPVQLTYLKDKLKDRLPMLQGDLLVIRAKFTVKRSDYGINKGQGEDKVSDDIALELSITGQS